MQHIMVKCTDVEKPCFRLCNRDVEMKMPFLPTRSHKPAVEGIVYFLVCVLWGPDPAYRAREGNVSLLLMSEE